MRGESHVMVEAETETLPLETSECQEMLAAARRQQTARGFLMCRFQREHGSANALILDV